MFPELRLVQPSGRFGMVALAAHELQVDGQPGRIIEPFVATLKAFPAQAFAPLRRGIAPQMGHVGIADNLFGEGSGLLRVAGGKNAADDLFDPFRRVVQPRKEPAGRFGALLLVPRVDLEIADVMEPRGHRNDFQLFIRQVFPAADFQRGPHHIGGVTIVVKRERLIGMVAKECGNILRSCGYHVRGKRRVGCGVHGLSAVVDSAAKYGDGRDEL